MKYLVIFTFLIIAIACTDGDKNSRKLTANELFAIEKGYEAADSVINSTPGMAREKALLSIRATQQQIMTAGDTLAALAFARAAQERLDSAALLK